MNNRWTFEEESKLIKSISAGKTYKELSGGFNRSENALELRVKKIIYENIINKKPIDRISQLLNMSKEKVMQYYYSYKDHFERENKLKEDKQFGGQNINGIELDNKTNLSNQSEYSKLSKLNNNINNPIIEREKQFGGNDKQEKINKLEMENKKMKLLLENYMLKHNLTKVLKSNNKHVYNDLIKTIIDK
jgi:hypothetical protein